MPSVERVPVYKQRYTKEELTYLRRTLLLAARALPRGPKRNEKRQTALSLRRLFRNNEWLDAHLIEAQPAPVRSRWFHRFVPNMRARLRRGVTADRKRA